jgi:hypothetical protein
MNFGSNFAMSMVLIQRVFWKIMRVMEMIEKMCFSIKQMMSITFHVHYLLISNQELSIVYKMGFIATYIILKTFILASMVVVQVTTGQEVS